MYGRIHEDVSTRLTPPSRKRTVFRGAHDSGCHQTPNLCLVRREIRRGSHLLPSFSGKSFTRHVWIRRNTDSNFGEAEIVCNLEASVWRQTVALDYFQELFMQGFAPADESLLFRQKGPKPCLPVRGPAGSLRLRTESRWLRNSLRSNSLRREVDSGLRLRRARRRGTTQETNQLLKLGTLQTHVSFLPQIHAA